MGRRNYVDDPSFLNVWFGFGGCGDVGWVVGFFKVLRIHS